MKYVIFLFLAEIYHFLPLILTYEIFLLIFTYRFLTIGSLTRWFCILHKGFRVSFHQKEEKSYLILYIKGHVFFIVRSCSFFICIIFCSSVVLLLFQKSKCYSKFGSILQWYLVYILSLLKVWTDEWAKSLFLLKSKNVRVKYSKQNKILQLGLTININPINIILCILERNEIKSALRAIRSCWSLS